MAVAGYHLPWEIDLGGKFSTRRKPVHPAVRGYLHVGTGRTPRRPAAENGARLPPYYALDLRIEKGFTFKRAHLGLYADLLNVVKGDNPEFVLYNFDYTEVGYVSGLPLIPATSASTWRCGCDPAHACRCVLAPAIHAGVARRQDAGAGGRAEPPEAAPGAIVTLSALVVDPEGDPEVAWVACSLPVDCPDYAAVQELAAADTSAMTPEELAAWTGRRRRGGLPRVRGRAHAHARGGRRAARRGTWTPGSQTRGSRTPARWTPGHPR